MSAPLNASFEKIHMNTRDHVDMFLESLLQYYLPSLSKFLKRFYPAKSVPKARSYVLRMAEQPATTENTVLEKLQSKSDLNTIQNAAECMDHMAAGIDTTGDGLCFLMYELSKPASSHMQKQLHEELLQNPNAPLDSLPYLDAVIKEGLRCFPPIPMSFPRYVPEGGRTINGYFLPQGTIVSCQPFSLHRLDEHVFPKADQFMPERWLGEDGANERNRLFFSFGVGGRGCTGKK